MVGSHVTFFFDGIHFGLVVCFLGYPCWIYFGGTNKNDPPGRLRSARSMTKVWGMAFNTTLASPMVGCFGSETTYLAFRVWDIRLGLGVRVFFDHGDVGTSKSGSLFF